MRPIRILVDSFADDGLLNAQMGNAREIISRLDSEQFHVTTFLMGKPDARISARPNTRLIQLPERRQSLKILSEFLTGAHDLLFYLKASPASKWYLQLRKKWRDHRVTIGTIESQCNFRDWADLPAKAIHLWEQTILRCDRLYSNSASVQSSLMKEYGVKSEVVPTGADTGFYTPDWSLPRGSRPRVLFVGALRPGKHPEMVLEAATRFPEADFRIVGEGPLGTEIRSRVVRENLKNVVVTGPMQPQRLRQEYRQADIFFFPSTSEGSPKVIVEAAACGLPVVCRNDYAPETVLHRQTGYLADSEDGLFSYLKILLGSAELRLRMGQSGRAHSERFDWDAIAAQWTQVFCQLSDSRAMRYAS